MSTPIFDDEEPNPNEAIERGENTKSIRVRGPTFAASESSVDDLSSEILRTIPQIEGELVRCRRIFGNCYRCNWWALRGSGDYDNPSMSGLVVTTHRIVRSRLLRATRTQGGLSIESDPRQ
jgi:hypothetical protein